MEVEFSKALEKGNLSTLPAEEENRSTKKVKSTDPEQGEEVGEGFQGCPDESK